MEDNHILEQLKMKFWTKSRKSNPYETRTITLKAATVANNPDGEIKRAIWALIQSNCIPPRSGGFSDRPDTTPVQDLTVQTFYVVYSNDHDLVQHLGRLDGKSIALDIVQEMIDQEAIYEPYLIDKIGAADWQTAKLNDENGRKPGRLETARDARLVDVFLLADDSVSDVRVVGRESLPVERARLQKLRGRDPNVLAAVYVGQTAFTNPHLREYVSKPQIYQRQSRPIYIMEGRNAREFVVGPNIYDDIRVPGMPDHEWYVLHVNSSEAHLNVVSQLRDWSGNPIPPEPSGTKWKLKGICNDGNSEWFCSISLTQTPAAPISTFPDAHEVPPTIQIGGRVLPNRRYMPVEVIKQAKGVTPESGFTLDRNVFVYSTTDNRVFLLNLDPRKTVSVVTGGSQVDPTANGYELQDDSEVAVGALRYRWESRDKAGSTLPGEVVGVLFDIGDPESLPIEYLLPPVQEKDPHQWFIGNWRNSANAAFDLNITPIFLQNPDMYLSSGGNLVINFDGRDSQGRPMFKLALRNLEVEVPLIARADRSWQVIDSPELENGEFWEVPDLTFIGEGKALIFGTTYYSIKTSGTLWS